MSSIEIKVEDFESFFQVPFEIYEKDSHFVSLMKPDLQRFLSRKENPLFSQFGEFTYFTALQMGKPVGRIVVHIHHSSNQKHGWRRGFFGFFDCINESAVASILLEKAVHWLKQKGMNEIIGQFNLTAMQQIGIMTQGFEKAVYSDQVYTPEYLPVLLQEQGFDKYFPITTFEIDLTKVISLESMSKSGAEKLKDTTIDWRPITRKNLKSAMEAARTVLNAGFDKNPMFVPVTADEFWFQAKDLTWVMDRRLSTLVYQNDQPIGAVVVIPDINPMLKASKSRIGFSFIYHYLKFLFKRDRAVIVYYSVVPEQQGKGLAGAMIYKTMSSARAAGYKSLGVTWIADENKASLRQMENYGAKPLHQLHLFRKNI